MLPTSQSPRGCRPCRPVSSGCEDTKDGPAPATHRLPCSPGSSRPSWGAWVVGGSGMPGYRRWLVVGGYVPMTTNHSLPVSVFSGRSSIRLLSETGLKQSDRLNSNAHTVGSPAARDLRSGCRGIDSLDLSAASTSRHSLNARVQIRIPLAEFPPSDVHPPSLVSSNRLAIRPCWLHSLLGRDRRLLRQREAPVEEVNLLAQLSPHARRALFCPVCVRSPLVCA